MPRTVIHSRARYAVMAMLELSELQDQQPLSLVMISTKYNISLSYLEQLFAALRKNGLVKSHRGPGGGYVLSKEPHEITINDIVKAVDDSTPAKRPKKLAHLDSEHGRAKELWDVLAYRVQSLLDTVTLKDVLHQNIRL